MISDDLFLKLQELTKEKELETCIKVLVANYIDTKLAYWKLIDQQFREKKGMSFDEYEDTKREEWDGRDWKKKEEYHDWEGAIVSIQHFESLKEKWTFDNSKQNLQVH